MEVGSDRSGPGTTDIYREIVDNLVDIAFKVDEENRISWIAPTVTSLTGKDPSEYVGRDVMSIFVDSPTASLEPTIDEVDQGRQAQYQGQIETKDGERKWIGITVNPLFDAAGEVCGAVGTAREITDHVKRRVDLELAEERYEFVTNATNDVILQYGSDRKINWVSASVTKVLGWTPEELIGKRLIDIVADEFKDEIASQGNQLFDENVSAVELMPVLMLAKDGSQLWMNGSAKAVFSSENLLAFVISSFRNVDQLVRAKAASDSIAKRMEATLDSLLDPQVILRPVRNQDQQVIDFEFAEANLAACRYYEREHDELIGQRWMSVIPGRDKEGLLAIYIHTLETGDPLVLDDFGIARKEGADVRLDIRAVRLGDELSTTWRDVTERHELENRLLVLATHDTITGLANHSVLIDEINHALSAGGRHGKMTGVLMIDLDHFKDVNDSFGHAIGDRLLRAAADRFTSIVRGEDLVARTGGDEFAVVMRDLENVGEAFQCAQRILEGFRIPFEVEGCDAKLNVTTSIGIVAGKQGDAEQLLHQADAALYAAKSEGRDRISQFRKEYSYKYFENEQSGTHHRRNRETINQLRMMIDSPLDPHLLLEPVRGQEVEDVMDFKVLESNEAAGVLFFGVGQSLTGQKLSSLLKDHAWQQLLAAFAHTLESGDPLTIDEFAVALQPGRPDRYYDIRGVRLDGLISCTWWDVSEQHDLLHRYQVLVDSMSEAILEIDLDDIIRWASPSVEALLGKKTDELVGTHVLDLIAEDDAASARQFRSKMRQREQLAPLEIRFKMSNGDSTWMEVTQLPLEAADGTLTGNVIGLQQVEAKRTTRHALETLIAAGLETVDANDEFAMLRSICNIAIARGDYLFAWYGRKIDDPEQSVAKVAMSDAHSDYLIGINVSWGDNRLGRGPAGRSLRTGKVALQQRIETDPEFTPWRQSAEEQGFGSSACIPVFVGGELDGTLCVYASEADAFEPQAIDVLEQLARQLGLGLERIREQTQLAQAFDEKAFLVATIEQAAESVIVTDEQADIIFANPAALRSSGYSLDELLGKNPRIFSSGFHDEAFYREMWSRIKGGQAWHGVLVNKKRDGTLYEEESTIAPVYGSDGELRAYISIKHDLTTERELRKNLSREQQDHDDLLAFMKEIRPVQTIDALAALACQGIKKFVDIDEATLLLFQVDGALLPVGYEESALGIVDNGELMPPEKVDGLVDRTSRGAWWLDLSDRSTLSNFPLSQAAAAGGYKGVFMSPIQWEGEALGALCALTRNPEAHEWAEQRLAVFEELGGYLGTLIGAQSEVFESLEASRSSVQQTVENQSFRSVFQPIIDLESRRIVGYEALTRFEDGRGPDLHIEDAARVGLVAELELACARASVDAAKLLPPDAWISINFSPNTLISTDVAEVLRRADREIVVEITEYERIENYPAVLRAIEKLGGLRISVDDAGAGFASLRHILELKPAIVKLDISLLRGIDTDLARQALTKGLALFAHETGMELLAEGVERAEEDAVLVNLGFKLGQGYYYGHPAPPTDLS